MPFPLRLREWIDSDDTEGGINRRIVQALMNGTFYGALYKESRLLGRWARRLGYDARTPEGDAFEVGFEFAQEETKRLQRLVEKDRRAGRSGSSPDLDSPQPLP